VDEAQALLKALFEDEGCLPSGKPFVLREKLLVLNWQTVECGALAFGTTFSTLSTTPLPLSSRASFILLSNRRTRKRVKRGVDDDGRGARGGLVHVPGLHACSGLFGPLGLA
jgi:hypothetical protein